MSMASPSSPAFFGAPYSPSSSAFTPISRQTGGSFNMLTPMPPSPNSGYYTSFPLSGSPPIAPMTPIGSYFPPPSPMGASTGLPLDGHLGEEDRNPVQEIRFQAVPSETQMNRLQWYNVSIKFTESLGRPMFVGRRVLISEASSFHDLRKRSRQDLEEGEEYVELNVTAVCAESLSALSKCSKCQQKDRAITESKRKPDGNNKWNDEDEENNQRLVQVVVPRKGEDTILSDGGYSLRLRIGCCVGGVKQLHSNHILLNGSIDTHKNCPGLALKIEASSKDFAEPFSALTMPIRVLGKVIGDKKGETSTSAAKRKQPSDEDESDPKDSSYGSSYPQDFSGRVAVPTPKRLKTEAPRSAGEAALLRSLVSPPAPSHFPLTRGGVNGEQQDSISAVHLHHLFLSKGHYEPMLMLHNMATAYRKHFDSLFPASLPEIYEKNFFSLNSLRAIPRESPTMLVIYSIVGAITVGVSLELADSIWENAIRLAGSLEGQLSSERDIVLFSDATNRLAAYFGANGSLAKARQYVLMAHNALAKIPDAQRNPNCSLVFESILWTKATYFVSFDDLQLAYAWANANHRRNAEIYTLFLLVISLAYPEVKNDPSERSWTSSPPQFGEVQTKQLLSLTNQLRDLMREASYPQVTEGRRSYESLFNASMSSVTSWLSGNYAQTLNDLMTSVTQIALLPNPQVEAFIPLFLAAFVSIQMGRFEPPRFRDYAEVFCRALMRIPLMRFTRVLVDHLIRALGILHGTEETIIDWTDLRSRNCDNIFSKVIPEAADA